MKKRKYLLVVQGEGRGHMTQALSMYELLTETGNEVCGIILGSSGNRDVPSFFFEKVECPVYKLESPNFVADRKNKSINLTRSVVHNVARLGTFRKSLRYIHKIISEHQPDVVVNFFDLLIGLYYKFYKPAPKLICIAHQYIYLHPDFEFPQGRRMDKFAIKLYTKATAFGSVKNLALSFYRLNNREDGIVIVPPLLRKEVFQLQPVEKDFYLVYLVNNGYFEELVTWHYKNPNAIIQCFTDKPAELHEKYTFDKDRLFVNPINDKLFLEMMSQARGLASSAGFESICEAMYLGKPVMMVPIKGHYEQFCNSRDACKAGAAIFSDRFDLGRLATISLDADDHNRWFKNWVLGARHQIHEEVVTV